MGHLILTGPCGLLKLCTEFSKKSSAICFFISSHKDTEQSYRGILSFAYSICWVAWAFLLSSHFPGQKKKPMLGKPSLSCLCKRHNNSIYHTTIASMKESPDYVLTQSTELSSLFCKPCCFSTDKVQNEIDWATESRLNWTPFQLGIGRRCLFVHFTLN